MATISQQSKSLVFDGQQSSLYIIYPCGRIYTVSAQRKTTLENVPITTGYWLLSIEPVFPDTLSLVSAIDERAAVEEDKSYTPAAAASSIVRFWNSGRSRSRGLSAFRLN
jgi:hypothetical protein